MDENTREEHEVEEPTPTPEVVGRRLRSAREGKGLSLEEAARELHLAVRRVEALENGDPDQLPPAAFVVGYIRNYARLLGLPPEELVDEYSRALGGGEPPLHASIGGEEQVKSSDTPVRVVTYLIILALIVLAGAWWWTQRAPLEQTAEQEPPAQIDEGGTADLEVPKGRRRAERDSGAEKPAEAEPEAAEEPADGGPSVVEILKQRAAEAPPEERVEQEPIPEPEGEGGDGTAEETMAGEEPAPTPQESPQPESEAATDTAPQAEETAEPEPVPEPAGEAATEQVPAAEPEPTATGDAAPLPPEAPQAELVLTFDNDCWTEVTDAEGRRLLYALVSSGSRRVLRGEAPFEVFLGYAPGVTVRYEGEVFDHSRFQHQDIARFTVGEPEDNQPLTGGE